MPDAKIHPFTVHQGSKAATPPAPAAPVDPEAGFKAEVKEVLTNALALCEEWTEVIIIFRSGESGVDTCYTSLAPEDRHALLSKATYDLYKE